MWIYELIVHLSILLNINSKNISWAFPLIKVDEFLGNLAYNTTLMSVCPYIYCARWNVSKNMVFLINFLFKFVIKYFRMVALDWLRPK